MSKNRFALMMEDGAQVRNIDDLKAHFDIGSVVRDFSSGRLLTWLEDRYYDDEAEAIKKISPGDDYLAQKLCRIFGVESEEEKARRKERLARLSKHTNDKNILANVDKVAFDQEDLADLLDEGVEEIYLCDNRFVIPLRMTNKTYIGVKNAVVVIRSKEPVDFARLGITFKSISFDDDYKKLLPTSPVASPFKFDIQSYGDYAEVTTTIVNLAGIHAHQAALFVQKASSFKSKVQLKAMGKTIDAKSMLMIMSMGLAKKGIEVTIIARGKDAYEAVSQLKALIDSGFGES